MVTREVWTENEWKSSQKSPKKWNHKTHHIQVPLSRWLMSIISNINDSDPPEDAAIKPVLPAEHTWPSCPVPSSPVPSQINQTKPTDGTLHPLHFSLQQPQWHLESNKQIFVALQSPPPTPDPNTVQSTVPSPYWSFLTPTFPLSSLKQNSHHCLVVWDSVVPVRTSWTHWDHYVAAPRQTEGQTEVLETAFTSTVMFTSNVQNSNLLRNTLKRVWFVKSLGLLGFSLIF